MTEKTRLQSTFEDRMGPVRENIGNTLAKLFNEDGQALKYGPVRYCVAAVGKEEAWLAKDNKKEEVVIFGETKGKIMYRDIIHTIKRKMTYVYKLGTEETVDEKWDFYTKYDGQEYERRKLAEESTVYFIVFAIKKEMCKFVKDFVIKIEQAFESNPEPRFTLPYEAGILEAVEKVKGELERMVFPADFLETITQISSLPYESRIGKGGIHIFLDEPEHRVSFEKPIEFSVDNVRHIRKLLEMTDTERPLLAHLPNDREGKVDVVGMDLKKEEQAPLAVITINGHMSWVLTLTPSNDPMKKLVYHHGTYHAHKGETENGLLRHCLNQLAVKSGIEPNDKILGIVDKAKEQKHGALLIVLNEENARNEARRLCKYNKGIRLKSAFEEEGLDLSSEEGRATIVGLTSIDGAIIVDLNGKCYAIGVILDGVSIEEGNSARGSRYNSAKNYVKWRKNYCDGEEVGTLDCVAVVLSEDKTLDVFSSLAGTT